MKINKYAVNVRDSEVFFALPKEKREHKILGIPLYKKPFALPWSYDENVGWDAWSKRIREEYPIQGFFREYVMSHDFPPYAWISRWKHQYQLISYAAKRFIKPKYPTFRKHFPRHTWKDAGDFIDLGMLAILCDFRVQLENSCIDYDCETHKDHYNKLVEYTEWIKQNVRFDPSTDDPVNGLLDKGSKRSKEGLPYEEAYKELHEYEQKHEQKVGEILHWMVDNRDRLWT